MTRITRKQKIEALQIARTRLGYGFSDGICYALPATPAGNYLARYISTSLGRHGYLTEWLGECGHFVDRSKDEDLERLRATRLAWIDWMIKEAKP